MRKLTNDGLASVVRLVEKEAASSIEEKEEDKMIIHLTKLDKKAFDQINQLIDTYLKVKETNQENLSIKRSMKQV